MADQLGKKIYAFASTFVSTENSISIGVYSRLVFEGTHVGNALTRRKRERERERETERQTCLQKLIPPADPNCRS